MKDVGKSIKQRLLNKALKEHIEFMKVLVRYLHERLLYRISVSPYRTHFLLKGSSLVFAYDMFLARPTVDIDLLGENVSRDEANLRSIFEDLCAVACPEDGVSFDRESIHLEPIALEKKYPGSCLSITAHLDTIVQTISIDIGFGDVVTPYPLELEYPLILEGLPQANLYAYSLETLIAEKFHAMIDRDSDNSRMKDFFDVYYILANHQIDKILLKEAVFNTFLNRGTLPNPNLRLFTQAFAEDSRRNNMWNAFLRKIRWKQSLPFQKVHNCIRENMLPIWEEYEKKFQK